MAISNIILDKLTTRRGPAPDYSNQQKYCLFLSEDAEVLDQITIIDVDVFEDSEIMDTPVESGIVISDHRIKNPKQITVNCTLPFDNWKDTYDEMRGWYERNDTKFLTIQTKADVYEDMQLISIPHKETADSVSRLFFELTFRSILFVKPKYVAMPLGVVENAENASTVSAGPKQGSDVPDRASLGIGG